MNETADIGSAAQSSRLSSEAVNVGSQFGELRFNDPDWLLWWSTSHYLLLPREQLIVATRLMTVVHAHESRQVLEGFILGTQDAAGIAMEETGQNPAQTPIVEDEPRIFIHHAIDEQTGDEQPPMWKTVWRTMLRDHPKIVVVGGVVLGLYAFSGFRSLWKLVFA